MRRALVRRLAPLGLLLAFGACGGDGADDQLVYRVTTRDGAQVEGRKLALVATELDTRLGEAGVERRSVSPVGPGRVRVVLPESMIGRIPELRRAMEDPDGLDVTLTLVE